MAYFLRRLSRDVVGIAAAMVTAQTTGGSEATTARRRFGIALFCPKATNKAAEHLLAHVMRRAELLVKKQSPQIHKLAFALLEHDSLTGDQVKAILTGENLAMKSELGLRVDDLSPCLQSDSARLLKIDQKWLRRRSQ